MSRYFVLKPWAEKLGITVAELERLRYETPTESGFVADEITAMPRDEPAHGHGLFQMLPSNARIARDSLDPHASAMAALRGLLDRDSPVMDESSE